MANTGGKVIIRLGSHSEKEYVEKTIKHFNGIMVGANLIEISPAATASLLFKLQGQSGQPYFLDPMTYAFGAYVDPESEAVRQDLEWIKSDQKVKGGPKGQTKRDFKNSYKKLAEAYGPPFSTALERSSALKAEDFPDDLSIDTACKIVLDYQANRMKGVFEEDPETALLAADMPQPGALIAPYFYIEMTEADKWINLNRRFALSAALRRTDCPVHVIACCHRDILKNRSLGSKVIAYLKESESLAAWIWFSRLDEHSATLEELRELRWWIDQLAVVKEVFNLHGGYFSLALTKAGLSGIAHGVGYGEQKDVVPIIGQSTPTVQYYLGPVHAKYSVAQITRCFSSLAIRSPQDFFDKICDCAICKGIIQDNLDNFAKFGEIHYSTPRSKRAAQTPAAAKRCRFHFLLNRIKERNFVDKSSLATVALDLVDANNLWSTTFLGRNRSLEYLDRWIAALG